MQKITKQKTVVFTATPGCISGSLKLAGKLDCVPALALHITYRTFLGSEWSFCTSYKLANWAVLAPLLVPGLSAGTEIRVPFSFVPFLQHFFSRQILYRDAEDLTKSAAAGAYLALQKMKLLAGRWCEHRETREGRDLKYDIFLLEGPVTVPFHLWEPFLLLLCCLPCCQSRECLKLHLRSFHTEFAYQSERRLSDLSFCMLSLLRSSLSYVKKAIRVVSVYFKQNGC